MNENDSLNGIPKILPVLDMSSHDKHIQTIQTRWRATFCQFDHLTPDFQKKDKLASGTRASAVYTYFWQEV